MTSCYLVREVNRLADYIDVEDIFPVVEPLCVKVRYEELHKFGARAQYIKSELKITSIANH